MASRRPLSALISRKFVFDPGPTGSDLGFTGSSFDLFDQMSALWGGVCKQPAVDDEEEVSQLEKKRRKWPPPWARATLGHLWGIQECWSHFLESTIGKS